MFYVAIFGFALFIDVLEIIEPEENDDDEVSTPCENSVQYTAPPSTGSPYLAVCKKVGFSKFKHLRLLTVVTGHSMITNTYYKLMYNKIIYMHL